MRPAIRLRVAHLKGGPTRDQKAVRTIYIYNICIYIYIYIIESVDSIIESVDSISRDERDVPLTQYITNA